MSSSSDLSNRERHGNFIQCNSQSIRLGNEFALLGAFLKIEACACFRITKILPVLAATASQAPTVHRNCFCGDLRIQSFFHVPYSSKHKSAPTAFAVGALLCHSQLLRPAQNSSLFLAVPLDLNLKCHLSADCAASPNIPSVRWLESFGSRDWDRDACPRPSGGSTPPRCCSRCDSQNGRNRRPDSYVRIQLRQPPLALAKAK
jgi:hypothetical protein